MISITRTLATLTLLASTGLGQAQDAPAPTAPPAQASEATAIHRWSQLGYGMFIHFGMSTYTGREHDAGDRPSTTYAPSALDVDQWLRVARDAGMKYAVLTAKHTSGHCLWDSKVQFRGKEFDYDVATSSNPTDVVEEFVKACKKYDITPGLYWCLLDYRNNAAWPPKTTAQAAKVDGRQASLQKNVLPAEFFQLAMDQLAELIERYPEVGYYWIDIPRAANPSQRQALYEHIKKRRPATVVLLNHGAGKPAGPMTIANAQAAWPTDILNTERWPLKPGWFKPQQSWKGKSYTLGYEHCDTIRKFWFWLEKDGPRPARELHQLYQDSRAGGGNFLLNVPPDKSGRIPAGDVKVLQELKQLMERPEKPPVLLRAEVRVGEKRLDNGDSELSLTDSQGKVLQREVIHLSTHHRPATTADAPAVKNLRAWDYGAFLCYNSNQFSGLEHCPVRDPKQCAPSKLNVKQWADTLKAAGMKYAVLTTRHTSGFLLWDSPTTPFDVANSSDTTDVVKAYVDECRNVGIVPGLYYCMWGGPKFPKGRDAEIRSDTPRAVILWQLRELATRYGKIPYFWIDMMNWAPSDLKPQDVYDLLKNINPDCVVIFNQHIQDGRKIVYFPSDVLNGELTYPPATGHQPVRNVNGQSYHLPFEFEACSQWRPGAKNPRKQESSWFTYGPGKAFGPSRSYDAAAMHKTITHARKLGSSAILLSCAPDHSGQFRDDDVKELTKLKQRLDESNK